MKILSVDTSTPTCTVGVANGDSVLAEFVDSGGQTHARHLMDMIHKALTASEMSIREIDGFAVVTGPGTFTGLRIGIGTIKGLAFALSRPVVGVTSLATLAAQADLPTKFVCPVMDARRNEVYYGLYAAENGELQQIGIDRVGPPEVLVKNIHDTCQFIGSGARLYRDTFESLLGPLSQFSDSRHDTVRAESITRMAMVQFQNTETEPLSAIAPYYIRRSDAELHVGKIPPHPLPGT